MTANKKISRASICVPTTSTILSLFTSISTLICCALPALLVTLGLGATLAGLVTNLPWLITFTKYKKIAFAISGIIILITGLIRYKAKNTPCPINPNQAIFCKKLRKITSIIFYSSVIIWIIGFFFAFLAIYFI